MLLELIFKKTYSRPSFIVFSKGVKSMGKALKFLDWLFESVTFIAYVLAILVMFLQVVFRYIFGFSLMWGEEFSRIMFVWIVYMGTPIVINRKANIEVDYFTQLLPKGVQRNLKAIMYLIASVFLLYVGYLGTLMVQEHVKMTAHTLPISQAIWYLPIAIGFFM